VEYPRFVTNQGSSDDVILVAEDDQQPTTPKYIQTLDLQKQHTRGMPMVRDSPWMQPGTTNSPQTGSPKENPSLKLSLNGIP
jgi:hypothetical protein